MPASPITTLARHLWALKSSDQWTTLRHVFEQIPDPRHRRGRRFTLPDLLTTAVAAVLSGAATYLAITDWARRHAGDLADKDLALASKDTYRRVLSTIDADLLDQALGSWARQLAGQMQAVAIDGKELRGARRHAKPVRLLSATTHGPKGVVIGQVAVGDKTNEIPMVTDLLDQVGSVNNLIFTLDALHCQQTTAQTITARGGHWVLTIKANQPSLLRTVTALPWNQIPTGATSREKTHGRATTRSIKVCLAPAGIGFPHATQVAKIQRTTTKNGHTTREDAYIITDLDPTEAPPARLGELVRGHWTCEVRTHWCRDVDWREDHHQAATGSGPRVMASLRNTAMAVIRVLGNGNIARTLRFLAADLQLTAAITGL